MKKIKISELPLFSSLKGLHTIGTDDQNRSVKVSLEFIERETEKAVTKANTASNNADAATAQAVKAKQECDTATSQANDATKKSVEATAKAVSATSKAETATGKAEASANAADEAKVNADQAASNAITVKLDIQEMLDRLVPTGLSVQYPKRLTLGNPKASVIADLTPPTALRNVIFISDDKAAEIDILTGRLTPVSCGKTKVRIVPTTNVSLTKTILIEVGRPTIRLATKKTIRLTSGGAIRLN